MSASSQRCSPCLCTCPSFMHVNTRLIFFVFASTFIAAPLSFVRVIARGVVPPVRVGIHSRPSFVYANTRGVDRVRASVHNRLPSVLHAIARGYISLVSTSAFTAAPLLKFQVRVRTSGPGPPNLLNPDPQVRFGPLRWVNPNLNIGSGSGANPVHQVHEPDHGQSNLMCET